MPKASTHIIVAEHTLDLVRTGHRAPDQDYGQNQCDSSHAVPAVRKIENLKIEKFSRTGAWFPPTAPGSPNTVRIRTGFDEFWPARSSVSENQPRPTPEGHLVKRISVNGVELCAETFGDPADPPVLLVGVTMLSWPDELCAALAGRYVVRYDLRDAGQSTYLDPDAPAYDLRDLVTDASELLAALGLGRAHVAGVGVGGFIAQLLALDHPDQVASLTLVSARPVAPGPVDPDLPDHAAEAMGRLFGRPAPDWADRDSVVDYMTGSARVMWGPRGFDEQDARTAARSVFDRARPTAKAQRASHLGSMFAAIDCRPRWRERLGEITAPTLVLHGDEDPFFPHGNGVALAAEIPGATLLTLPGIGHGVPRAAWPDLVEALLRHTS
jgi:pimeloyl-ACP methyl ester carboxylesterase